MAKFLKSEKGIGYLEINDNELIKYSHNMEPVCDECNQSLLFCRKITLIPILNEAYCRKCGPIKLKQVVDYSEDRPIRYKREEFYKRFFNIKDN